MTAKSKFYEEFGRLMDERGYTLKVLSDKSGISIGQLSNLKTGVCEPNAPTIYRLSEALDCDYNALFKASTTER